MDEIKYEFEVGQVVAIKADVAECARGGSMRHCPQAATIIDRYAEVRGGNIIVFYSIAIWAGAGRDHERVGRMHRAYAVELVAYPEPEASTKGD